MLATFTEHKAPGQASPAAQTAAPDRINHPGIFIRKFIRNVQEEVPPPASSLFHFSPNPAASQTAHNWLGDLEEQHRKLGSALGWCCWETRGMLELGEKPPLCKCCSVGAQWPGLCSDKMGAV